MTCELASTADHPDDADGGLSNPGTVLRTYRSSGYCIKSFNGLRKSGLGLYESFLALLLELVRWRCRGVFRPESSPGGDNDNVN